MPEFAGRITFPPRVQRDSVGDAHPCRKFRIEVPGGLVLPYLVTGRTTCGGRLQPRFLRMARETRRVTGRHRFEGTFLKPKAFAEFHRRLCDVFLARVALGL